MAILISREGEDPIVVPMHSGWYEAEVFLDFGPNDPRNRTVPEAEVYTDRSGVNSYIFADVAGRDESMYKLTENEDWTMTADMTRPYDIDWDPSHAKLQSIYEDVQYRKRRGLAK